VQKLWTQNQPRSTTQDPYWGSGGRSNAWWALTAKGPTLIAKASVNVWCASRGALNNFWQSPDKEARDSVGTHFLKPWLCYELFLFVRAGILCRRSGPRAFATSPEITKRLMRCSGRERSPPLLPYTFLCNASLNIGNFRFPAG
jgi:hypothetical protein